MSHSGFLKLLLVGVLALGGCRVQALYVNGEASARIVDALTAKPVAQAAVNFCGVKQLTAEDGSFHVDAKTDWEWVMVMAGRSPLDTKRPCYVSIVAEGYQPRYWLSAFDVHYDFSVRLLPLSSPLGYKSAERPFSDIPLQVEPSAEEAFIGR